MGPRIGQPRDTLVPRCQIWHVHPLGTIFSGQRGGLLAIMTPTPGGISEAEYRELPRRFNLSKFDPNTFVDLARAAGQEYMVFTTKHHDGFCMFDSSYTDYKITNTPYGKDVVRQLADACQ